MRFRAFHPWVVSCLLSASITTGLARAQSIIYVDDSATGANDGSSWCDAFVYLQDSLAAAEASGGTVTEIRVAQGIYTPDRGTNQTIGDRAASFNLVDGVTLRGGYAGCGDLTPERWDPQAYEAILSGDLQGNDAPNESDCCHIGSSFGCEDAGCESAVCIARPECCAQHLRWVAACVVIASNLCPAICGGDADNAHHIIKATGLVKGIELQGLVIAGGYADSTAPLTLGSAVLSEKSLLRIADCQFAKNKTFGGLSFGGAIYSEGSLAYIRNCTFLLNQSEWSGGAVSVSGGAADVRSSRFISNSAGQGGGISIREVASLHLQSSTMVGNSSYNGGAVSLSHGQATIHESIFLGNKATGGGAVYINGSDTLIDRTLLAGNSAQIGAGIESGNCCPDGRTRVIQASLLIGNHASGVGGGVSTSGDDLALRQSLLVANMDAQGAAGIRAAGSTIHVENAILWFNGYGLESEQIGFSGDVPSVRFSNIQGLTGGLGGDGNLGDNPLFVSGQSGTWTADAIYDLRAGETTFLDASKSWSPGEWVGKFLNPDASQYLQTYIVDNSSTTIKVLGDFSLLGVEGASYKINDYRLSSGSPCIDAADNSAVLADVLDLDGDNDTAEPVPFDLDGNPRFKDDQATPDTGIGTPPIVDMGAYEYQRGCLTGADCDNLNLCDGVEACVDNVCEPGTPIICDDGEPCNGTESCNASGSCVTDFDADCNANQVEDDCDIANGAPDNNGNSVPDECEPGACCAGDGTCNVGLLASCVAGSWSVGLDCDPNPCAFLTSAAPTGCRYLAVTPNPTGNPSTPIALQVTSSGLPCMTKYVALDSGVGRLIDFAAYAPPATWGDVVVADSELIPGLAYDIRVQTATAMSDPVNVTLRRWGDVVEPWEQVSFVDISAAVGCFGHVPGAPALSACDLAPSIPDQVVDFVDIAATVSAFQGLPYPFAGPCP